MLRANKTRLESTIETEVINFHLIEKGSLKTSQSVTDIYGGTAYGKEFRVQVDSTAAPHWEVWKREPGGLKMSSLTQDQRDEILDLIDAQG